MRTLVLIVLLALNFSLSYSAPLNGTYTIGGSTPDYSTINAAITALSTNGVSGPVVFNIRSGIYVTRMLIGNINGSSSNNTITFQSESLNPKDVVIQHMHIGTATNFNYTLYLDGADNLIFNYLTFEALPQTSTSTDANRVVYITNDANNIKFNRNIFKSWFTTSSSFNYSDCIYIGTDYDTSTENDYIEFSNNIIIGGNCGISYHGSKSSGTYYGKNLYIQNNQFEQQGKTGINVVLGKNIIIKGNQIKNTRTNILYTGIAVDQNTDSLSINANYIYSLSSGYGIGVSSSIPGSVNYEYVTNNIINIGPENTLNSSAGISTFRNKGVRYSYNTINILSNNRSCYGVSINSNDTSFLYNNIIYVKNGDNCLRFNDNNTSILTSNYNVYFNNNNDSLIRKVNVIYNTITDYSTATGNEIHSMQADPQFSGDVFPVSLNAQINNKGLPISNITFDYYGKLRSISTPDIGAIETNIPTTNAALISSSLQNSVPCPHENFPITVKIGNSGSVNLTSLKIKYNYNGTVYGPFSWIGNLVPGASDSMFVNSLNIQSGMFDFDFKIWVEQPNNIVDSFPYNDTLNYTYKIPLSGTYTVGDTGADFSSLLTAAGMLNTYGVCGPVVLNIKNGVYTETVLFDNIKGTSPINTLTIQSASNDSSLTEIRYSTPVLGFKNCNNITIRGLTINTTATQQCTALSMEGCYNITICNNIIKGTNASSLSYLIDFYTSTPLLPSNYGLIITNNIITAGYNQLRIASRSDNFGKDNVVSNNIFSGNCYRSIQSEYQENIKIINNIFDGTRNHGVLFNVSGKKASLFEKNKVNVSISGGKLLSYENCTLSSSAEPNTIQNNFFSSYGNIASQSIYINNSKYLNIYHNNFNILAVDTATYRPVIEWTNTAPFIAVFNNVFNSQNGIIYKYIGSLDTSSFKSDYNNFFTTNRYFYLYVQSGSNYRNYSQWLAAHQRDEHSIYSKPTFASNSDLHILNSPFLEQAGKVLPGIVHDIDNDVRAIPPDIGADEFVLDSANYFDVALLKILEPDSNSCQLPDSIGILVYNKSNFPVTSLAIRWFLFETQKDSIIYTVSLMPHDTIRLNLATFNYNANTYYEFGVEILYLNNKPDNVINDNKLGANFFYLNDVSIKSKPDGDCTNKTTLYIKHYPQTNVLWTTGETSGSIKVNSPGTYGVTVTNKNGCVKTGTITIN